MYQRETMILPHQRWPLLARVFYGAAFALAFAWGFAARALAYARALLPLLLLPPRNKD
jgi:hypothetical protein